MGAICDDEDRAERARFEDDTGETAVHFAPTNAACAKAIFSSLPTGIVPRGTG